jgi:signal transduction histidine kinase
MQGASRSTSGPPTWARWSPTRPRASAGINLSITEEPGLTAAADPDRLAQVVANLTENALKFAGRSIAVGAAHHNDRVTVWVDDDGPGIPPEDLPHVFEPFWRSHRAPAREVGTGLGLAIVAELVAAMGGTVEAHALPAGGTRMVVALKRWRAQATRAGSSQDRPLR